MSGDLLSIQELGGAELATHYPDRQQAADTRSHNCIVHTDPEVTGFISWLGSFEHHRGFGGVLSANGEGLRLLVSADRYAIFIPWNEMTVSAVRGWPATIVRLTTTAVPWLTLVLNLDDESADDLFGKIIPALPQREPPRQIWWGPRLSVRWVALIAIGISAGLIGWLLCRGI